MNRQPNPTRRWRQWRWRVLAFGMTVVLSLSSYTLYTIQRANFRPVVSGEAYRSGQMDAEQLARTIERHGIKSIVNLRGGSLNATWYEAEIETAARLGAAHYDRDLDSGEELTLEQMDDLVALLRQAPKPVLIHCLGGADRSGLASGLYRLAIEGRTPKEAEGELSIWYGHVPLIRPKVTAMDRSFWRYVSNRVSRIDMNQGPGSQVTPSQQPAPLYPGHTGNG